MNNSLTERVRIWNHNEHMAQHFMRRAPTLEGHVLLVCDTTDAVGGPLAQAIAERNDAPELLRDNDARTASKGEIPTMLAVVELALMKALMVHSNPNIAKALDMRLRDDRIFVVVIADGGTTLMMTSKPTPQTASVAS